MYYVGINGTEYGVKDRYLIEFRQANKLLGNYEGSGK